MNTLIVVALLGMVAYASAGAIIAASPFAYGVGIAAPHTVDITGPIAAAQGRIAAAQGLYAAAQGSVAAVQGRLTHAGIPAGISIAHAGIPIAHSGIINYGIGSRIIY